ncbi:hypothetical protein PPERSA_11072 [Pseudocohnilembus persalinus]|uniref:Protein-L-isoaspartate O-methyltransferase n=1 Tax=Pseudocohnilembus persalinus TaxID=266149 RepID=A0A0V0QYZ3_PSEPJ|nr:hypothetical protein PPERSA_11072 [Pseudocohnilembus persalinus]|eukprot:KRX07523.1 hypothetical protein PPERSA_11072 [Pseudocohnilembus persalinus]
MQYLRQNQVIKSDEVLEAMEQVDRADYCNTNPYIDSPQLIGYNVTISAPHMHAISLEFLKDHLKNAKRVLDIGSGTGFLTVAMFRMMKNKDAVSYGVEHIQELVDQSIENIKKKDKELLDSKKVQIFCGDGRKGLPKYGPYDCIHVGAAPEKIPQELLDQLAKGGRMVIPVGSELAGQEFQVVDKDYNGQITSKSVLGVRYVPLTSREQQIKY